MNASLKTSTSRVAEDPHRIELEQAVERSLLLLLGQFPERLVELDRGCVAVREKGDDTATSALVLLHGIGSGATSWLHCALKLHKSHRVVAWDAPGYGRSSPLAADAPSARDYAERLTQTLDAMAIRSCVIVGHSLGAMMAMKFAALARRQHVRRIVLLDPARGYGRTGQAEERADVLRKRLGTLDSIGVDGMALQAPDRLLSPAADAQSRAWIAWNTRRLNPSGYAQAVHMLCSDSIDSGDALDIPTEVHCGDADHVTTPAACEALAFELGASFALIPKAGHASPVEQPAFVASLLARANEQAKANS